MNKTSPTPCLSENRREIGGRLVSTLRETTSTSEPISAEEPTIDALRAAATECTACPLYLYATQTVFGDGPAEAQIMLVGEQPGDAEDLAGHPFVGPAG